ncbi:hypothetical protein HOLleu_22040 [Holothuria leucospilota]|uniref:Uncharacterized protein n=1 Tax=Holothuria leucospilota TaxID=206669 RepID=A0A9Q1BX68_HOLLE|nr:hypothetical protein HOLleu_22040 [Holothuria leucospilota]
MEWLKTVRITFLLNVVAISLQAYGSEYCEQSCTDSAICVVRSGCTIRFQGKTLKCLGNSCHLTLKYDFSHIDGNNAISGQTETREVTVRPSLGNGSVIIDNLRFTFREERMYHMQDGEIESELTMLIYIDNSSPVNSGRYEIELYDNLRFKTIYSETYQCRIVHFPSGPPDCSSVFMPNTVATSYAYILTCSIQEGYPPIEVNISSTSDCAYLESRSSNSTWKTVTFFVPSCSDKAFSCSASSKEISTPIPFETYSGKCSFDLSGVKITSQTQMTEASNGSTGFFNDVSDIILIVVVACLVFIVICGLIFITGYIKKTRGRSSDADLDSVSGGANTFDDYDTDFPAVKREVNDGQAYGNV